MSYSDRLKQFIVDAQKAKGKNGKPASIRQLSRDMQGKITHSAIGLWLKGEVGHLSPESIELLPLIDAKKRDSLEIEYWLKNGEDLSLSRKKKIKVLRSQLKEMMSAA